MIGLILTVMFLSSIIHADITTDVECAPGGTVTGAETDDDIIWQQLPETEEGHLLSSQYFTDLDQSSETADDFRINDEFDAQINSCKWWGGYWATAQHPYDPDFTIYIYGDDGEIPTFPYCSSHLAEYFVPSGTTGETFDPVIDRYVYESDIIDFVAEANTKYWIVYQCHLYFQSGGGQWGISSSNESNVWENDVYFTGDVFGYTTWQDGVSIFGYETDIAHELWGTVGLENITWGGIKTLF